MQITDYMLISTDYRVGFDIQDPKRTIAVAGSKAADMEIGTIGNILAFNADEMQRFGVIKVAKVLHDPNERRSVATRDLERTPSGHIQLIDDIYAQEVVTFTEFTEQQLAEERALEFTRAKDLKTSEINSLLDTKTYLAGLYDFGADIGNKRFQLRNVEDEANIAHVALRASVAINEGEGDTFLCEFRMADNTIIHVTANQFVAAAKVVMDKVMDLRLVMWAHKDAVAELTTLEEVEAYDAITGWPL